jgi:titin
MNRFNAFESLESRMMMSITPGSATVVINPNVPASPTALTAAVSGHSVKLQWTDNSNNETGFDIERYSNNTLVDLGTVSANTTTFTDASAPVGLDWYVVRSFNTAGHGEGAYTSVTIKAETPVVTVIAPNKISIYAASNTQLNMGWQGDAGATGGYTIQRSANGSTGWTTVGTTAAGTRYFDDKNLSAKTKYFYRIIANGTGGATATSTVFYGLTKASTSGDTTPTTTKTHK